MPMRGPGNQDGTTKVVLGMVFSAEAEFQRAKGFGAVDLGLQTLGRLERFDSSAAILSP